jgi:O-antigen ligase
MTTTRGPDRRVLAERWAVALLCFAVALVAVLSSGAVIAGGSRTLAIAPLVALAGAALMALGLVRFSAFVIALLALRASLDAAKIGVASGVRLEPAGIIALLFLVFAGAWLLAHREQRSETGYLTLAMGALIVTALASAVGADQLQISLQEWARITAATLMLFVLLALLRAGQRPEPVVAAIYLSSIPVLLFAAVQTITGTGLMEIEGFARIRGTFTHPNPLAMYLAILLVMGVALLPHVRDRVRLPFLLLLGGLGVALLATYTRGGWLAAVVGLLVVGLLQDRRLIVLVLLGAVALTFLAPSTVQRFSDLTSPRAVSGSASNSFVWRVDYWTDSLALTRENPVTGIGLGMVRAKAELGKAVHNDFIRAFVEMGVLGFCAYLGMFAALATASRRALRRAKPGLPRGLAVGFAAILVMFAMFSISSNVMSQVVVLWYMFAFAALAIGANEATDAPERTAVDRKAMA